MWTFEISTGWLLTPQGKLLSVGYAGGNRGKNPEGINNVAFTGVRDVGPLPEGYYTLGQPVNHSRLGPFAIPLRPDPANDMKGRGDFFMHGDTTPPGNASEGCIIQPRATRSAVWESVDHRIRVVANLPS